MIDYTSTWLRALCDEQYYEITETLSLQPITCWQVFVLTARRNRFFIDIDTPIELYDSLEVLYICGNTFEDVNRTLNNNRLPQECLSLYRSLGITDAIIMSRCSDYIRKSIFKADRFATDGGRKAGGPLVWYIVKVLCETYNMSTKEAWNTKYSLARSYFDIHQEELGRIDLVSDNDIFKVKEEMSKLSKAKQNVTER